MRCSMVETFRNFDGDEEEEEEVGSVGVWMTFTMRAEERAYYFAQHLARVRCR